MRRPGNGLPFLILASAHSALRLVLAQLQLQILPLFFKEFQADKTQATVWHFNKNSITLTDSNTFSFQFIAQYEQLFAATPPQPAQADNDVVKLFDE